MDNAFREILRLRRLAINEDRRNMFRGFLGACKNAGEGQRALREYEISKAEYARLEGSACGWGVCLGVPYGMVLDFIDRCAKEAE